MIKNVTHDAEGKLWCGPAVISAITGWPTSYIIPRIKNLHNYADEWGVPPNILIQICKELGYELRPLKYSGKIRDLIPLCLIIVDAGAGHYIVSEDGFMVDSCYGISIPIAFTRFDSSEVRECWQIVAI